MRFNSRVQFIAPFHGSSKEPMCADEARLELEGSGHGRAAHATGRRGFSLIEVMIVVVILGLLASVVTYATQGYLEKAKKNRARSDISTYSGGVDAFYLENGRFPDNQEGLKVLVPQFIKVLQNDPWGHPYQYVQPGKRGPYDIVCYGADGREGGGGADADVTNSDPDVSAAKKK
jgi:general secretion pathway protein G